ncbi:MAG: DUF4270 domain-containing protein [Bacteroidales bacterium]|nr:DUF4270 domain-containing protein [Bacteroidales bacterium]
MKRKFGKAVKQALLFSGMILAVIGCEKEAKEFGDQIMPSNDSITAEYDTSFQVKTFVERSDSFPTLYSSFEAPTTLQHSNLLLGDYFSPYFGSMKARFMSQIYKADSLDFSSVEEAIGATLYFQLGETYGSIGESDIRVYKLNKKLDINNNYYSTTNPEEFYDPHDLISESSEFLGDSIIKVNLTQSFAEFLTTAEDTIMGEMDDFIEFFPGIFVEMKTQGKGFLNSIKITNDTTRLELTCKEADEDDTLELEYPIPPHNLRVNTFEHNHETATATEKNVNRFLNNDTTENDSILLINGPGGTRGKLLIPEKVRETFRKDSNFLARAEIELKPLIPSDSPLFPESVGMYAYPRDTSYISISQSRYFNGEYDEDRHVFSCNITSYLQAYINEEVDNNRLYIQTRDFRYRPGQLIISGANHTNPLKLRIKYFKP